MNKWIMVRHNDWRVIRIHKGPIKKQKMRLEHFNGRRWWDVRSACLEDVEALRSSERQRRKK